jgi:ribosome-associated protein
LAPLSAINNRKTSKVSRLNRNSKIFKTIISAIQEKKGSKITSLDLRNIPEAVADFLIICEATSHTQVKAIADFVENQVKQICYELPYRQEGQHLAHWILIDYANVGVHIMQPDARKFYRLQEMWSDTPTMAHSEE